MTPACRSAGSAGSRTSRSAARSSIERDVSESTLTSMHEGFMLTRDGVVLLNLTAFRARPAEEAGRHALTDPAACVDARVYQLDDAGLEPCGYDDLDAVRLTRAFLDAPERFVRAALAED